MFRTRSRRYFNQLYNSRRSYSQTITALNPLLWLKHNETSGNPINRGSASLTISQANCTQGSTGLLGTNEAYTYNATTSIITINNSVAINALSIFTYAFLVYPINAGENSAARLWNWGNAIHRTELNANRGMTTVIESVGGNATTTCANNTLTFNGWQWIFVTYDSTGDKRVRYYIGRNGVLTEPSYTTHTASAIAPQTRSESLYIGNRNLVDTTFNGLFDESLIFNQSLTTAQMLNIVKTSSA